MINAEAGPADLGLEELGKGHFVIDPAAHVLEVHSLDPLVSLALIGAMQDRIAAPAQVAESGVLASAMADNPVQLVGGKLGIPESPDRPSQAVNSVVMCLAGCLEGRQFAALDLIDKCFHFIDQTGQVGRDVKPTLGYDPMELGENAGLVLPGGVNRSRPSRWCTSIVAHR